MALSETRPSCQVNGVEFKVVVPENCGPGKVIEMEVPSSLTQEGRSLPHQLKDESSVLEGIGLVTSRSSSYEACHTSCWCLRALHSNLGTKQSCQA